MRFADEQLQKFYDEWAAKSLEIDGYIRKFNAHIDLEDKRWVEIIHLVEQNRESTEKLIDIYNTIVAGKRIMQWIGEVAKWLIVVGSLFTAYNFIN